MLACGINGIIPSTPSLTGAGGINQAISNDSGGAAPLPVESKQRKYHPALLARAVKPGRIRPMTGSIPSINTAPRRGILNRRHGGVSISNNNVTPIVKRVNEISNHHRRRSPPRR